jgi:hypothetical protein
MTDLFDLTLRFTQEQVENHCLSLNTDIDVTYALVNQLALASLMNNIDSDLKDKLKTKLATINEAKHGAALGLFFIRELISSSTAKQSEYVTGLLRKLKLSHITGENVELGINQFKSLMNILTTANRAPDDSVDMLLEFMQTSSNKKFTAAFSTLHQNYKLWGPGTAGQPNYIDETLIYGKALTLYKELVQIKQWIKLAPSTPGKAANANMDANSTKEDGKKTPLFPDLTAKKLEITKQFAAGMITADQAKVARKAIEKEKKARRKKTDKSPDAAMQSATPPGNNQVDKIKEFVVDGIRLKGDTSRPKPDDFNKPRTFTKIDGGTIELNWCRLCGKFGGQWQIHKTETCPSLNSSATSSAARTPNDRDTAHVLAQPGVHWNVNTYASSLRNAERS